MADNEARVTVRTIVEGSPEARLRQGLAERWNTGQSEANRFAREQAAAQAEGGSSRDRIDRVMDRLRSWKLTEEEINKLIAQRRRDLETFRPTDLHPGMAARPGLMTPRELAARLGGYASPEDAARGKAIERQIQRLEDYRKDVQEGLYAPAKAAESAWDKFFPKFGGQLASMLKTSMGLIGIGSAVGIAAQARSATRELNVLQTDLALMMGLSPEQTNRMRGMATAGGGAFGLTPANRMNIMGSIYGGFGQDLTETGIQRFAGLGLAFGRGREGFAELAGQMSMTAFTPDRAGVMGAERFGTAVLSASGGLSQTQKQFYLESNRNLLELFTRFHGGKPLNAEEFVGEMNGLMQAVRGLGLVGGGLPMIRGMVEGAAGLVPMGGTTGEIYRMGALLGISPEEAAAKGGGNIGLGFTQIIGDLAQPGNMGQLFRRIGRGGGLNIQPGQELTGQQMNQFRVALTDIFKAPRLGELTQTPGGVEAINAVLRGTTPQGQDAKDKLEEMSRIMKETAAGRQVSADATYTAKEITEVGNKIVTLETTLKDLLGPSGAMVGATIASGLMGATPWGLALTAGAAIVGGGALAVYNRMRAQEERKANAQAAIQEGVAKNAEEFGLNPTLMQGLSATQQMVADKAAKLGINPALMLGIVQRESNFNPTAKNPDSGAAGLGQVIPSMQKAFGLTDPFSPEQNLDVSMTILKQQLKAHGGDVRGALQGYVGSKDPKFPYIDEVLKLAELWTSALDRNSHATEQNTRITERGIVAVPPAKRPVPKASGGSAEY